MTGSIGAAGRATLAGCDRDIRDAGADGSANLRTI